LVAVYIYPGNNLSYLIRVKQKEASMTTADRKALIADYKDRETIAGVFAVIFSATGRAWVGQSRHIDTQQNGLWFALKMGGSPYRSLQAEWTAHGADSFRFEQLDRLSPDLSDMTRKDELQKRAALWAARLEAERL
jgi:hypothetical protein